MPKNRLPLKLTTAEDCDLCHGSGVLIIGRYGYGGAEDTVDGIKLCRCVRAAERTD